MKHRKSAIDPITIEIISNGLRSIADETFVALMKSAYSTNIKERRDHSTVVCDREGRLITQADGSLPIHIASMTGLMRHLLENAAISQKATCSSRTIRTPPAARICPTSTWRCRFFTAVRWSASCATSRITPMSAAWFPAAWPAECPRSTRKGCGCR
jgi:hypothetical protein